MILFVHYERWFINNEQMNRSTQMSLPHKPIEMYFESKGHFNQQQHSLQMQYQSFAYNLDNIRSGPEKSVALRKLLESFDAAMRAAE